MATFDRIDGQFVARCTFDERLIFKNNGWDFDKLLRKWVTTDDKKARNILGHATGAAKEYFENLECIEHLSVEASWAEDSDLTIPVPEGLSFMPFQRAGIAYAADRPKTLIADPPGLGKTVQAIGVHNMKATVRVLIICPASLRVNWEREFRKWDVHGRTVGIACSVDFKEKRLDDDGEPLRHPDTNRILYRSWVEHEWPDTDVVIVNYDMLETFDDAIKTTHWDLLVCDEAHLLKTPTAVRSLCIFGGRRPASKKDGKVVRKAKRYTPVIARHSLFLTGTPILSKPVELWTLIRACDPTGLGSDWEHFVYTYCDAYPGDFGIDTSGASNTDELNRLLRERFMVRRSKVAVLKELPPKRRELILLPHDKLEKPLRKERTRVEKALAAFEADVLGLDDTDPDFFYISAIESLTDKIGAILDDMGEDPSWESAISKLSEPDQIMFTELSIAREEVALAKVGYVVEHVQKMVEAGEPVILFAHHKSVIAAIRERLEKAGLRVGIVTGAIASNKRQAVVDRFQAGELDVIHGNILAMGVGFTMTASSTVIFAELDWVPALIEQAEDRAWRHGQTNAVLVQHLVVDGSIEARMAQRIIEKMEIIFETLDARHKS